MPNTLMILFTWCTVNFVFITWLLTRVLAHQREESSCLETLLKGLQATLKGDMSVDNKIAEIIDQLEELKKLHQPIIKSVPVPSNQIIPKTKMEKTQPKKKNNDKN